jgi:hypothetical protein
VPETSSSRNVWAAEWSCASWDTDPVDALDYVVLIVEEMPEKFSDAWWRVPALLRHGLKAFSVVPRAPNFRAFSRVSANFEREYVSTS